MSLSIVEVLTTKQLKSFIKFPEKLYKKHPLWVPALFADEMTTLRKDKNPAFEHCEARYFLAYKEGEIVGRVAAIINHNANTDWKEENIKFGWIDFIDDYEVSKALLDSVAQWGRERGMNGIQGPLGFSDMDKEGLLVEGFENLPSITTLYNYHYYQDHILKYGLEKEIDWFQRKFVVPDRVPEKLAQFDKIVKNRYGVKVFNPRSVRDIRKRAHEIFDALNSSFSVLYEFTELNKKQVDLYIGQYIPFLNKHLVSIVLDKNDKVIAFAITMPSLSKAVQKAKGRLFPFGFIHMVRALYNLDFVEMYMIGIVPEYQNKGINAVIFNHIHENFIKYGVKEVVTNPQLETNTAVISLFDDYKSTPYMTRRCFYRKLSDLEKLDA